MIPGPAGGAELGLGSDIWSRSTRRTPFAILYTFSAILSIFSLYVSFMVDPLKVVLVLNHISKSDLAVSKENLFL